MRVIFVVLFLLLTNSLFSFDFNDVNNKLFDGGNDVGFIVDLEKREINIVQLSNKKVLFSAYIFIDIQGNVVFSRNKKYTYLSFSYDDDDIYVANMIVPDIGTYFFKRL